MAHKAKVKDLKRGTHKGRRSRTSKAKMSIVNHPAGIRGTGLNANANLTAAALSRISPTPNGPEPHWPAGTP